MLLHKIPPYWIILSRNQRITSIFLFWRLFPLGTFYFPFCFSWILLKIPICGPRHIAIRKITSGEPFKMRAPVHDHFHHMSPFITHSYELADPFTTGPWLPIPLQLLLGLQERFQSLPPGAQGHPAIQLFFAVVFVVVVVLYCDEEKSRYKGERGGTTHLRFEQHFTGALKMSSRGQAPWGDKIMTLLYSHWSKENQFLPQNLEEGRENTSLP